MGAGLVKGEGLAVRGSWKPMPAAIPARRRTRSIGQHPSAKRAVAAFLSGLDDEDPGADRKPPKVISPADPCSAWTAKASMRVQLGYDLNSMIDVEHAVIIDVEATPARTYDEVAATRTMIDRTEKVLGAKRLAADTADGTGKMLA